MIRAVLFDLDGIVITGRKRYFSEQFAEEHGVPMEDVSAFFLNDFKKCVYGQCDLKETIAPYLPKWKWEKGTDAFLDYWFGTERTVDEKVMSIIEELRRKGYPCYIATRQERYRMQYLLDTVGLRDRFDGYFCTSDIGADKHETAFWDRVLEKLSLSPEEILYFDDAKKNIDYTKERGIDAHFYDGIEVLEREAGKLTTSV